MSAPAPSGEEAERLSQAFWTAVQEGKADDLETLKKEGHAFDVLCAEEDHSAVHLAADNGDCDVISVLLDAKCAINARNNFRETPLHRASYTGHPDVVRLLLKRFADLNLKDEDENTALHLAAIGGRAEVVKILVEYGADVHIENKYKRTPLHWACNEGHLEVVQTLTAHGARTNVVDRGGQSPVDLAKSLGDQLVIKALEDVNVSSKQVPDDPWSVADDGNLAAVRAWRKFGNINALDKDMRTPLMHAAAKGRTEVLEILLRDQADVTLKDNDGNSALHLAVLAKSPSSVMCLLKAGSDELSMNSNGQSAVDLASKVNHMETMQAISNAEIVHRESCHSPTLPKQADNVAASMRQDIVTKMRELDEREAKLRKEEDLMKKSIQKLEKARVELQKQEADLEIPASLLVLGAKLGQGCYGEVFRADYYSQTVAVKKIHAQNLSEATRREFFEEVAMLKRLRHPNCVLFLGASTVEPHLLMVTEFLGGGTLYDVLHRRKERLSLSQVLAFAVNIASGLNYLNMNNIVHRDVKSLNVLVDGACPRCRVAKVADFGLSRSKQNSFVATKNAAAGTLVYMAPEQLDEKPFDEKVDVFAFGIMLCEMISGRRPWDDKHFQSEVITAVLRGERPGLPSNCPAPLKEIVVQCWKQNPRDRPSFMEVLPRLKELQSSVNQMLQAKNAKQLPFS